MRVALVTTTLAASVKQLSAQTLEGRFVPADTTALDMRASLLVLDSLRTIVGRVTVEQGFRFRMVLPKGGVYFLRVLSIGFAPEDIGPVHVSDTGVTRFEASLPRRRVLLDAIKVVARNRCHVNARVGSMWLSLWQQAREQLSTVEIITVESKLRARVVEFRGLEDFVAPLAPTRSWETRRFVALVPRQTPYQDALTDMLATDELVSYGVDGAQLAGTFVKPLDPSTLATDAFLAANCFGMKESPSDAVEWIGVTFRPVDDEQQSLYAVTGVLWIDATSGELRRLDYASSGLNQLGYGVCIVNSTRCEHEVRGAGGGGSLELQRLGDNAWVVSRWEIRSPPVATARRALQAKVRPVGGKLQDCTHGRDCTNLSVMVPQQRVAIGAIGALDQGGREVYRDDLSLALFAAAVKKLTGKATGGIEGRVVDSLGAPIANAIVYTRSPDVFVRSDSAGMFRIWPLRKGSQTLRVQSGSFRCQSLTVLVPLNASVAVVVQLVPETHSVVSSGEAQWRTCV